MLRYAISPDIILRDGNVICMDATNTTSQAIAVKGKKIMAIGSSEDISLLIGENTEVINLEGRTVLPGFVDSHVHVEHYGRDQVQMSLRDCKNEEETLKLLKRKVEQTKPGVWITACGVPMGKLSPGKRGFTLKEVDAISSNNPVYIECSSAGHYSWINSYALKLLNITKDSCPEGIKGGRGIVRDSSGELTGRLQDDAWNWGIRQIKPYTFNWFLKALQLAQEDFLKVGVTAAHSAWEDPYILSGFRELEKQGKLRMRTFISLDMENYSDLFISTGMSTGFGSDMLMLMRFKIVLNVPPHAAVFEDYASMPGNRGYHLYPPEWVEEKVLNAVQHRWSVLIHVMGDGDTDMALTAYEKALEWYKKRTGKDNNSLRLQLCHYKMSNPSLIERTAAAKILVSIEPSSKLAPYNAPGGLIERLLGYERWVRSHPVRSFFDAGINVAFGSDYPMPYGFIDPRAGIYASLDGCGHPWDVITAYQALQGYTINGAFGVFSEKKFGSIEVGKFADFVVFSDNPLTMPKDRIWDAANNEPKDLLVDYTIVGGKIEYKREEKLG